jgi:ribosomal protein L13
MAKSKIMNKLREIKKVAKRNGSITLEAIHRIEIEALHQRHVADSLPRSNETRETLAKLMLFADPEDSEQSEKPA